MMDSFNKWHEKPSAIRKNVIFICCGIHQSPAKLVLEMKMILQMQIRKMLEKMILQYARNAAGLIQPQICVSDPSATAKR